MRHIHSLESKMSFQGQSQKDFIKPSRWKIQASTPVVLWYILRSNPCTYNTSKSHLVLKKSPKCLLGVFWRGRGWRWRFWKGCLPSSGFRHLLENMAGFTLWRETWHKLYGRGAWPILKLGPYWISWHSKASFSIFILDSEHQELAKQVQEAEDSNLREDLERELDQLVTRMELKGQQISKLKRHQEKVTAWSFVVIIAERQWLE